MANKIAIRCDTISLLLNSLKAAVPYQGNYRMSRKGLPAIVFPQSEPNSFADIVIRNVHANHTILARFVLKSAPYIPPGSETNLGGIIIFPSIKGNHDIQVTFEYKPWPYLDVKTVLLIHFEGLNNGTTFEDSSSYDHEVAAISGVSTLTNNKRWGKASGFFNGGGGQNITSLSSDYTLGTNDFTFDFWFRLLDLNLPVGITGISFFKTAEGGGKYIYCGYSILAGVKYFNVIVDGVTLIHEVWSSLAANEWFHVALVRYQGTIKAAINGHFFSQTATCGAITESSYLMIGDGYRGYIDEFRFRNGDAVWTDDFEVPKGPYSDQLIPELSVQFDLPLGFDPILNRGQDIRLLLHMDELPFIDSGNRGYDVTNNGSVALNSTFKKWTASGYFTQGAYLSVPASPDWDFNVDEFTISFWIYPTAYATRIGFFMQGSSGTDSFYLEYQHGVFHQFVLRANQSYVPIIYQSGNTYLWESSDAGNTWHVPNKWFHVALVKHNGYLKLFFNGEELIAPYTNNQNVTISNSGALFQIGRSMYPFIGYMDEFVIAKTAIWTSSFTPPPSPFGPQSSPIGNYNEVEAAFNLPALMSSVIRGPNEHDILLESPIDFDLVPQIGGSIEFNLPMTVNFFTDIVELIQSFVFSNRWKKEMMGTYSDSSGVEGDYRAGLMDQYFVFDPDTHEYFDGQVDADEIPETYGYVSGMPLVFKSFSAEGVLSFEDFEFPTANGGRCGPISSVVIYDYASHAQGLIVGCIILSTAITLDGSKIKLSDLSFQIV